MPVKADPPENPPWKCEGERREARGRSPGRAVGLRGHGVARTARAIPPSTSTPPGTRMDGRAGIPRSGSRDRASRWRTLSWTGVIEAALLWLITHQMTLVARSAATRLDPVPILATLIGLVVVPIAWTVRILRMARTLADAGGPRLTRS